MDEHPVLFVLNLGPIEVKVTVWKLIGYAGSFMFTGRWFVQLWASKVKKRPVVPRVFWYMSMCGSTLLLSYFIWGKNDSVGILTTLFPSWVAGYNLFLDIRHARSPKVSPEK
jgi:lipid-A-disaccharide synthase-like uncharacterized protein